MPYDPTAYSMEYDACQKSHNSDSPRIPHKYGTLIIHESCAELIYNNRILSYERNERYNTQRIIDLFFGYTRGKIHPIGKDRLGYLYWYYKDFPTLLFISTTYVYNKSNMFNSNGELVDITLPPIRDSESGTTGTGTNPTGTHPTTSNNSNGSSAANDDNTIWYIYSTISDVSQVISSLSSTDRFERVLRKALCIIYPTAAATSTTGATAGAATNTTGATAGAATGAAIDASGDVEEGKVSDDSGPSVDMMSDMVLTERIQLDLLPSSSSSSSALKGSPASFAPQKSGDASVSASTSAARSPHRPTTSSVSHSVASSLPPASSSSSSTTATAASTGGKGHNSALSTNNPSPNDNADDDDAITYQTVLSYIQSLPPPTTSTITTTDKGGSSDKIRSDSIAYIEKHVIDLEVYTESDYGEPDIGQSFTNICIYINTYNCILYYYIVTLVYTIY